MTGSGRRAVAAGLALLLAAAAPAWGRDGAPDDCLLDGCAATPAPAPGGAPFVPRGGRDPSARRGSPGDFDFYVLALSWSPAFCRTPAAARAKDQCASGAGLGFVVHGLWPQYEKGYPQDCPFGAQSPSRFALQAAAGLYPSEGLARHEWRKHGACSGKSPTDYFADVRHAREAIVVPSPFVSPAAEQNWTAIDVERAFVAANPRLRPGMIGVACRGDALQDVRICLTKDLRAFRPCPEVTRRRCPIGPVAVPPAL